MNAIMSREVSGQGAVRWCQAKGGSHLPLQTPGSFPINTDGWKFCLIKLLSRFITGWSICTLKSGISQTL